MNLNEIGKESHEINAANGWEVFTPQNWPDRSHPNCLENARFVAAHVALIHSEVSEALEGLRHQDKANFSEELADIIIRVTSVAHGLGIDLEQEITKKAAKNKLRGFRHGGKAI